MLDIQFADAKIFYDQEGNAKEVLINYEVFRCIQDLLEQLRPNPEQGYFWSDEWQARIRESEGDIYAGRTLKITADNIDKVFSSLTPDTKPLAFLHI